jgi:hypothetical protein
MLSAHRCRKPQTVLLGITRSVFTLTVRLIDRRAVDSGACRVCVKVVRVDIVDMDDQARVRHIRSLRFYSPSNVPLQPRRGSIARAAIGRKRWSGGIVRI